MRTIFSKDGISVPSGRPGEKRTEAINCILRSAAVCGIMIFSFSLTSMPAFADQNESAYADGMVSTAEPIYPEGIDPDDEDNETAEAAAEVSTGSIEAADTEYTIGDASSDSASNAESSSGSTQTEIDSAAQVAAFALQYVGNPYRYGGTSLTNGADCSGFVLAVYRNFGITLPHSSSALRNVGRKVASLEEARPGDIITYSGHAGIYIGGGRIVNAESRSRGITVISATYKSIKSIRRVL